MDNYANGYDLLNTYSSTDPNTVGGIIAIIFGILAVILFIVLVVEIFHIIGLWKMFKKANEEGWKALIPIYNTYTLCKVVGVSPWWILIVILSPILGVVPIVGSLLSTAASIYFLVILAGSVAKSYGKDTGWAVGYALLTPFFTFALGVGKSEYQGPKPIGDPIMDKIIDASNNKKEDTNNKETSNTDTTSAKFCSSCGTKVEQDAKYCPNCGNKL